MQLGTCSQCGGFLGIAVLSCPNCGAALSRARRIAAGMSALVGGGAFSMTLMACYGPSCVDDDCRYDGDRDAEADTGRTRADAQVMGDAASDGALDARPDVTVDGGPTTDASSDAPVDAPSDGG